MAKVLYLTYDGLTDPLGQSQILPYLSGLSDKGHQISIVSFEKEEPFKNLKSQISQICLSSQLKWIPLSYTKKPPILSTIKDLRNLEKNIRNLLSKIEFDFIHCRSYVTSLIALKLRREKGIPFIFDMRGFYPDERVDGQLWNLSNPLYQKIYEYFKVKEYDLLEEAQAVVSLTHEGKREIEKWYLEKELFGGGQFRYNYDRALSTQKKVTVIPCSSDLVHFDYHRISDNKRAWLSAVHGIDAKLQYLGYVGSLGTWYMGKEMLELYAVLLKSNPKLRFLILTHDNLDELRKEAIRLKIPQSYIIQVAAQRKDVPALMTLMSASVFFILPAYSKKASSPTKQGELMAMGVPVICNDGVGDSAEIIRKYGVGLVLKKLDAFGFNDVVEKWNALTNISKEQIRRGAKDYFSLSKGVESYHRIYQSILQEI